MRIHHIAIWTKQLEELKDFYEQYFQLKANKKYFNPVKKFSSYFLKFEDDFSSIEIMEIPELKNNPASEFLFTGISHFAISVGSKEKVDLLTGLLRNDGFKIIGEPRFTGDGFYESVISDPDGNRVEITI
jgi:lactoylglutathione lyase